MHGTVCYLYYFTCGSYLGWAFWPNHPLFGYSWIQCFLGRKLPKGPSGVCSIRYSIMRIFGVSCWLVVSRIWATWWEDICNVGYGGRRMLRILWGFFLRICGLQLCWGRALGRLFGVVHAAGVTLVEYTAARLRVSGHKVLLGAVY